MKDYSLKIFLLHISRSYLGGMLGLSLSTFFIISFLNLDYTRVLYTLSQLMINIMNSLIPLIVFVYLFSTIIDLGKRAYHFLFILLLMVLISNIFALIFSYTFGTIFLVYITLPSEITLETKPLLPFFTVNIPILFSLHTAIMVALIASTVINFFPYVRGKKIKISCYVDRLKESITRIISSVFRIVIPIYVFSFIVRFLDNGFFYSFANSYLIVLVIALFLCIIYIYILYFIICRLSSLNILKTIYNMLPAAFMGLCTVSSIAALPVTVASINKNIHNKNLTQMVASSTVNIHIIGDNIVVIINAIALFIVNNGFPPSLSEFLLFCFFFSLANFAAVGIPGGNMVVIASLLQQHLGFSEEVTGLFVMAYILQDPLITMTNIFGNGAFAIFFKSCVLGVQTSTPRKLR